MCVLFVYTNRLVRASFTHHLIFLLALPLPGNIKAISISAFSENGTLVSPEDAQTSQKLTISCHFSVSLRFQINGGVFCSCWGGGVFVLFFLFCFFFFCFCFGFFVVFFFVLFCFFFFLFFFWGGVFLSFVSFVSLFVCCCFFFVK